VIKQRPICTVPEEMETPHVRSPPLFLARSTPNRPSPVPDRSPINLLLSVRFQTICLTSLITRCVRKLPIYPPASS
jgi:hypothetical protein